MPTALAGEHMYLCIYVFLTCLKVNSHFGTSFKIGWLYTFYYENLPMQYTQIFLALKIENFQLKNFDIFLIFAQNIDCRYTLEQPRRGDSNEYPQSMFWSKNKKNRYTPANPSFSI